MRILFLWLDNKDFAGIGIGSSSPPPLVRASPVETKGWGASPTIRRSNRTRQRSTTRHLSSAVSRVFDIPQSLPVFLPPRRRRRLETEVFESLSRRHLGRWSRSPLSSNCLYFITFILQLLSLTEILDNRFTTNLHNQSNVHCYRPDTFRLAIARVRGTRF